MVTTWKGVDSPYHYLSRGRTKLVHIHYHDRWYYVIAWNGDVIYKSLYGWDAARWARSTHGVELELPETTT